MGEELADIVDVEFEDFYEESEIEDDDPLDVLPPAKKSMVLFFLIDVSSSMKGKRIQTMNQVMKDVLPELIGVGECNTDVRVAVMAFSSGVEWVTPEPIILEEYQRWKELEADGVTDLGAAFLELNQKMSRKVFLQSPSLSYAPVIFLITDGCPTDNYKAGLAVLRQNNWFKYGIKVALALGNGVDMDVLEEFTGDKAFVVKASNLAEMKMLVKAISVTSSKIGSSSMPVSAETGELTEEAVVGIKQNEMKKAMEEIRNDIMSGTELSGCDFESGW